MVYYYTTDCQWLPANHFLFQLANICLVFSYLVPDTLNGLFLLRFWLGSAGLFFGLWGWFILCAPDTFGWNVVFMFFNYAHFIYLLIKVKKPRKFTEECETVFKEFFEPLGVLRYQFHELAKKSFVLHFCSGAVFAEEDAKADKLAILLSGSVEVMKDNQVLHITRPYEFLNSPEWAAQNSGEATKYGVTLTVRDSMKCLTWDSEILSKLLRKDKFLTNVFNSIIGQDVTKKLLRLNSNLLDIRAEDIRNYRTGSIVYLHKPAGDLPYPDRRVNNIIANEAVVRPVTPVLDISKINEGLRHDDIDADDQALIISTSTSPETPNNHIEVQYRKAIKPVPSSWQETSTIHDETPNGSPKKGNSLPNSWNDGRQDKAPFAQAEFLAGSIVNDDDRETVL